jgi:hypothetical protein
MVPVSWCRAQDVIWQMIYTFVPVLGVLGNFAIVGGGEFTIYRSQHSLFPDLEGRARSQDIARNTKLSHVNSC